MRTKLSAVLWLAALIAVGLSLAPAVGLAQDGHEQHAESADAGTHEQAPEAVASCGMHQTGETCMATMAKLKALLAEAAEAIEDNKFDTAAEKIAEATALLEQSHEAMAEGMADHQATEDEIANANCPMMGKELDTDNVPEDLTREFQGQTIGFCCPGCLGPWDKLSDDEKAAKLAPAEEPEAEADSHEMHSE